MSPNFCYPKSQFIFLEEGIFSLCKLVINTTCFNSKEEYRDQTHNLESAADYGLHPIWEPCPAVEHTWVKYPIFMAI